MTSTDDSRSVYLGLGTNIGDRQSNLQEAVGRIAGLGSGIIRASSIYETEPVGYHDQPWFLNQVIETNMPAGLNLTARDFDRQILSLLEALQGIEREMGRVRTMVNGPRVIDIDILLCGGYAGSLFEDGAVGLRAPILTIPHPRLHERRFVLAPLCEIAPDLIHPHLKKTCRELMAGLDASSIVRIYKSRV